MVSHSLLLLAVFLLPALSFGRHRSARLPTTDGGRLVGHGRCVDTLGRGFSQYTVEGRQGMDGRLACLNLIPHFPDSVVGVEWWDDSRCVVLVHAHASPLTHPDHKEWLSFSPALGVGHVAAVLPDASAECYGRKSHLHISAL
eukprot:Sspe_Gene.118390::Locus_111716_Transcript_1_3_Confidence_0.500_Length_605::g.118390::m.118390